MKKILIVSDAWFPQVNGVVRTLVELKKQLLKKGHEVEVLGPDHFFNLPCPTYPEIRLAVAGIFEFERFFWERAPDAIHIATEGPLGWLARRFCREHDFPFTTSYHTKFPEYVNQRFGIPCSWGFKALKKFHSKSSGVLVATDSLAKELDSRGFKKLVPWNRGVDTELFRPLERDFLDLPRPIYMNVGRVAVEKNLEAFLKAPIDQGSKVVVGGGPQLNELQRKYPEVHFVGVKKGEDLARHYSAADVFVFPSLTDTFGLVMIEALACGVPVAAYPVTGPVDIITDPKVGVLSENLSEAMKQALGLNRDDCVEHAKKYSWKQCAEIFESNLCWIEDDIEVIKVKTQDFAFDYNSRLIYSS